MILLSVWRPERPLIDPFCGSGTIPIEAALIGRNMAPGWAGRTPPSRGPACRRRCGKRLGSRPARRPGPICPTRRVPRIIGTDVDEGVLGLARFHAEKAGVAGDIHFQQRTFAELSSKRPYGCVICNPPYGERLGRSAEALALHRAMPDVFRRLKTWSFFILTALPDFEAVVGQSATRRRKLYNGRIQCTYYQFLGPKPGRGEERGAGERERGNEKGRKGPKSDRSNGIGHQASEHRSGRPLHVMRIPISTSLLSPFCSPLPSPVFGGLSAKALEQAEIFRARLTKRARHLRRWPAKMGISCYRLYEQDIPEVPLVVDCYEDYLHIAEFSRPTDHTLAEHADWLDLMRRAASEVMEVPLDHVFLKRRERQRGTAQYERLGSRQQVIEAHEGGLQFEVNLSDYLDTGLFLDHRITRGMVRDLAPGKRFLNLFAYTGSFTVYAAAGGAASTATVDLSNTYLDWAQRNMVHNGFQGPDHEFIRDDAMHFLQGRGRQAAFDLAVVDAPTFSNSKSLEDYWDIQRNHVDLLNRLVELMAPEGIIIFSTNFRRFKLAEAEIRGVTIREISRQTVPADFRNRRIHRCWRMAREG